MAKGKYHEWLEPDKLLLLQAWARDGLTDAQIAKNMGISKQTFYNWQKKYVDFFDSLKRGKDVIDVEVENALLKRALGYEYEEYMEEHTDEGWKTRKTTKHVVPDVTAQIFWLKNRRPDLWRDKRDLEMSGNINNPFEGVSTDDIKKLIQNE